MPCHNTFKEYFYLHHKLQQSQNHRRLKVKTNLKYISQQTRLLKAPFKLTLNTPRDRTTTVFLGNLFQYLTMFTIKKFLPNIQPKIPLSLFTHYFPPSWAGPWRGKSLICWSSGQWACCVPSPAPWRSPTPPSHDPCSQGCLGALIPHLLLHGGGHKRMTSTTLQGNGEHSKNDIKTPHFWQRMNFCLFNFSVVLNRPSV